MNLSPVSMNSVFKGWFQEPFSTNSTKALFNNIEMFTSQGEIKTYFPIHRDKISVLRPTYSNKDESYLRSIVKKLETPEESFVTEKELESFLDRLVKGEFDQLLSTEDFSKLVSLLVDYARKGIENSLEQDILEKDIENLFYEETFSKPISNQFKFSSTYASERFCKIKLDMKYGKKKGKFVKWCGKKKEKVAKFVKNHKKQIIIGSIAVVATAAVATLVTIAIINTVSMVALAEGVVASGTAAAGTIGAKQASGNSNFKETTLTSQETIDSCIDVSKARIDEFTELPADPLASPHADNIALQQQDISEFENNLLGNDFVTSHICEVDQQASLASSGIFNLQPSNQLSSQHIENKTDNLGSRLNLNFKRNTSTEQTSPENLLSQTQMTTDLFKGSNFHKQVDGDAFFQKLKNVGAKITHDLYDGWTEFEGGMILEAEKMKNFIAKLLPENMFDSLNANTYERQQQVVTEIHSKIDQFFTANQANSYLPENKIKANLTLGIMPSPWDILGSLKIPTTWANKVKGWGLGQPINNLTAKGDIPRWSAVRQRHWKNKAYLHENGQINTQQVYEPNAENIARMKKGLAPRRYNPDIEKFESIELHHIPSQKEGGLFNFVEVTPAQHAELDTNRYIGGRK